MKKMLMKKSSSKFLLFAFLFLALAGGKSFAKSLTVSLSATNNIEKNSTGSMSSSIKYDGIFYTGYYNLEVSHNYKVDDITSSSFGKKSTTFSYVKKGTITSATVWSFNKSFSSLTPCTKKVNGTLYAVTAGKSLPIACGTGYGHDIDKNSTIYRTIK